MRTLLIVGAKPSTFVPRSTSLKTLYSSLTCSLSHSLSLSCQFTSIIHSPFFFLLFAIPYNSHEIYLFIIISTFTFFFFTLFFPLPFPPYNVVNPLPHFCNSSRGKLSLTVWLTLPTKMVDSLFPSLVQSP